MFRFFFVAIGLFLAALSVNAQQVVLRHSLSGNAQDTLSVLVLRFNDAQKGRGQVVLESLSGVADKRHLPHMALLDEDDSRLFFDSLPRFRSLVDVMREGGQPLDGRGFLPQIAGAVEDTRGNSQALPLALTLPVLLYNKDAFIKAGLDPELPPRTWQQVQQAAGQLFSTGVACPITSSRFAWVHVENTAAQHGELALVRKGARDRFAYDSLVQVKHLALLASWHKSRYFHYFGHGSEADQHFLSGECAMITGESGLLGELGGNAPFAVGVAGLPYYDDVVGVRPGEVLPDGASLWVLAGKKKDEYKLVARFIEFLLRPDIQGEWVKSTGFLPMTIRALKALQASGISPVIIEAARKRLSMAKRTNARPRTGFGRDRLHDILNEEIAAVWSNQKPAKEALDTAMRRAGEEKLPRP